MEPSADQPARPAAPARLRSLLKTLFEDLRDTIHDEPAIGGRIAGCLA
jgi:hypothetical protein